MNRPSDGLLTVLLALRRALIAYGAQTEQRLRELCAPEVEGLSDPGMPRRTLTRWTQLGVFQDNDGRIELSPTVKGIEADDLSGFRSVLLQLVLADDNNLSLSAERQENEEERSELSKAADFSLAAAWALAQDPFSFATSHRQAEALVNEQRVSVRLFSNNTRWSGFVEWAAFLGIACYTNNRLMLNPFFAIAGALDEVFGDESELSQRNFLTRLAAALPILDGGCYRQIVNGITGQPWRAFRDNEISPCLSAGLRTLAEKKVLRLEPRSDAPQCTLLGPRGRDLYTFSHVVRERPSC